MPNTEARIDFELLFKAAPSLFLVLKPDAPDFTIVDASDAYLEATLTKRENIKDRKLFEIFTDDPNDQDADGVHNLRKSLEKVLKERRPDTMKVQKYAVHRPQEKGGGFETRYWNPYNFPVLDRNDEVLYIIHRAEDVTDLESLRNRSEYEKRSLLEELDEKTKFIAANQQRIESILEVLLKYTVMDFSAKLELSNRSDELDAIALGLNTLGEELASYIQQLKTSEERVRSSEKIFTTVFYQSPVMNAITDAKTGEFIDVNENFVAFFGYPKEEILGRTSVELNLMPNAATRNQIARELEKGGYSRDILLEIHTRENVSKWVSFSAHAVKMQGRDCFIKAMIDVTKRKEAEEQLQAINKELEAFSYSVSHDLRAPLRAVSGYSQMLNEDYGSRLDEEGVRIIEAIKYNAAKMGGLIDDLLAFSRLGRKDLQKTVIDMNELLEGVLIDLGKSTKYKAEIKGRNLPAVNADYGLLHQVVYNLVSNAIKYSSKKERPVIQISAKESPGEVVFCVKDNGAGFDMEYAGKLFGVFQRLHSQEEFEGTGVGLAIVQRIIAKHGGKVWAEGEVDKGAAFYFSLQKS